MRHVYKLFLFCFLASCLLFLLRCQNPFSPIKDLDKIPETITVNGLKIMMEVFLWRDFMPTIGAPGGSDLMAVITLTAQGASNFPDYIGADKLYVIYGEQVWETGFADEIRPRDNGHLNQIQLVARGGPKWPVESRVDVIVRVTIKGEGYRYIKALNQIIGATY
jgi:hypothetical protein